MVSKRGAYVGAAAFVVGMSLVGPQAAGVASAEGRGSAPGPDANSASDSGPRATRGAARTPRPAASRTATPTWGGTAVERGSEHVPAAKPSLSRGRAQTPAQPAPAATAEPRASRPSALLPRTVVPVAATAQPSAPAPAAAVSAPSAPAAAADTGCAACWGRTAPTAGQAINTVINHLFNSTFDWLATLPAGPISNLLEGALVLLRRSLFLSPEGVSTTTVGNSLRIDVNTGSVAYFRQDGTSLQVSGDPSFRGAKTFDATTVSTVTVVNDPGDAGCAGLVVESGTIAAQLTTTQIDAIRFGAGAAFTGNVDATVTGGTLTLRDAVRGQGVALHAPVVLANDVAIDAGSCPECDATFDGTVDGTTKGGQSLTVTAMRTTTFKAAVGSQTELASLLTRAITPLSIPQSNDTRTIPLHFLPEYMPNGQPQVKYGIDVAIGENPSQVYEFDTGGVSFFAGYSPDYWKNVPLTSTPISETYSSGIYYNGVVADTNITLGRGSQTVSTGQPIQIAAILAGGNANSGEVFDFGNPDAPPVEDHFFGDFGASFNTTPVPGQTTPMTNPLFQLPGNLSSGFLVQVGPIGIEPQLSVGVTDALRAQFTYAVPVAPQPGGGTYPVSGYDILSWFGFAPTYTATYQGTTENIGLTPALPTLIDSGAPSTGIRMKGDTNPPFSTTGTVPGQLISGATFTATFPTTAGRDPLTWTFTAGNNRSVNQVEYQTGAPGGLQNVNTGLTLYNSYDVMFDIAQQIIWLRPTGGLSTVNLRSVTTTGAQTYQQNAVLGGTYSTDGGDFSVAGVTTLGANTVVNTSAGDVRFSGTVDATTAGAESLEVNSSGTTTFVRGVGSLQKLSSLATDTPGFTSTASVQTTGSQTYADPVSLNGVYAVGSSSKVGAAFTAEGPTTLTGPVSVSGGDISFEGSIDSTPNRGFTLSLNPGDGGTALLNGDIGLTNPPGGLAVTANKNNTASIVAHHWVALSGDLANSSTDGLSIGPDVTATFDGGGLIRNFAGDGVSIGVTPAVVLPQPTVVDPVIANFAISGNHNYGINAMGTYGARFISNAILNNGAITGDAGVLINNGVHNTLDSNSIWSNGGQDGLGISLINGGNNSQAAPVVNSAVLDPTKTELTVEFSLSPLPDAPYTAQIFYTPAAPAQGQQLLLTLKDQVQGTVVQTIPVSSGIAAGGYITVTATTAAGDTSQFSAGAQIPT